MNSNSFSYAPSESDWWNHGVSTESDFIYVTTQNLSVEQLQQISDEVGGDKTLLVCCGAFRCKAGRFSNLTICIPTQERGNESREWQERGNESEIRGQAVGYQAIVIL